MGEDESEQQADSLASHAFFFAFCKGRGVIGGISVAIARRRGLLPGV